MLNNIIKNARPLTMNQLLKYLDYGRKLRSSQIKSSYKNYIITLVDKPTIGLNKKSSFEFKGKKFIKTFFTYDIFNKVKGSKYRVTLCVKNDKPKPTFNSSIQCYCGCLDFKFRMAYRLRELGLLIETKSTISQLGIAYTDEPKDEEPPALICKHIYQVLGELKKNREWNY